MRVEFDEEMVAEARRLEARVKKTRTLQGRHPDGLEEPDRYFIGYLGELAFARLLTEAGRWFKWAPRTDGKADNGDFTVSHRGVSWCLDVKTASKPHYTRLMMPKTQLERVGRAVDIYVAARVLRPILGGPIREGSEVEFHGWVCRHDFLRNAEVYEGRGVPTYSMPFVALHPMTALIEGCGPVRGLAVPPLEAAWR